ncbi:TlpA family protein disulfide reductase [Marivirga sp. S37H4]|uniref:TlpA family protein disulfide reductase n=1 Tax=Marivirga aurantiaca TaxID=2802615 RepID=A0A934X046_9BACT|nr:TlpA disulfide reductase family protein [Marivirga aurantiaca]MBK6266438.1 TlpA family protein disulfide reductase [Marivirga aurantiaca]
MIKKITLIVLFFAFVQQPDGLAQRNAIRIIEVPELEELIQAEQGKLKVINFWATWCKPCIKELPYFVEAQKKFPDVEFIFVSLDFAENESKVQAFSKKKGLDKSKMYLIDDLDYNSWIDKVSPDWSGAIPGTLIVSMNGKDFYEKEFHSGELEELIRKKNKK